MDCDHLLTQVDYRDVSGIKGVEWDAVELPSQFMENWCWDLDALEMISGHYQTGAKIPADLLEKARQAKNFQSAMTMLRQLEFALFDMRIHIQDALLGVADIQEILNEVRSSASVVPTPSFNRFQNSFTHIFAGGYAAGYFSYKWAEVLSADAFSRFEEEGVFNADPARISCRKSWRPVGPKKPWNCSPDFGAGHPRLTRYSVAVQRSGRLSNEVP